MGGQLVADEGPPFIHQGRPDAAFTPFSLETVVEQDPDVVFLVRHANPTNLREEALEELFASPAWNGLRAVEEGRLHELSEWLYLRYPGPRVAWALQELARLHVSGGAEVAGCALPAPPSPPRPPPRRCGGERASGRTLTLAAGLGALAAGLVASFALGAVYVSPADVLDAIVGDADRVRPPDSLEPAHTPLPAGLPRGRKPRRGGRAAPGHNAQSPGRPHHSRRILRRRTRCHRRAHPRARPAGVPAATRVRGRHDRRRGGLPALLAARAGHLARAHDPGRRGGHHHARRADHGPDDRVQRPGAAGGALDGGQPRGA